MYYHPKFETYENAIIGVILKWLVILRPGKKQQQYHHTFSFLTALETEVVPRELREREQR